MVFSTRLAESPRRRERGETNGFLHTPRRPGVPGTREKLTVFLARLGVPASRERGETNGFPRAPRRPGGAGTRGKRFSSHASASRRHREGGETNGFFRAPRRPGVPAAPVTQGTLTGFSARLGVPAAGGTGKAGKPNGILRASRRPGVPALIQRARCECVPLRGALRRTDRADNILTPCPCAVPWCSR